MEEIFHLGIKALFVNDENKVLVLKANPDDFKAETPVHWDLPGGRVEKGHSIEKTLAKEIEEELGIPGSEIIVERDFHLDISSMRIPVDNGDVGLVLLVKQCRLARERAFTLNFEHTEYKWVSIQAAKELLSFKFSKGFIDKLDELG